MEEDHGGDYIGGHQDQQGAQFSQTGLADDQQQHQAQHGDHHHVQAGQIGQTGVEIAHNQRKSGHVKRVVHQVAQAGHGDGQQVQAGQVDCQVQQGDGHQQSHGGQRVHKHKHVDHHQVQVGQIDRKVERGQENDQQHAGGQQQVRAVRKRHQIEQVDHHHVQAGQEDHQQLPVGHQQVEAGQIDHQVEQVDDRQQAKSSHKIRYRLRIHPVEHVYHQDEQGDDQQQLGYHQRSQASQDDDQLNDSIDEQPTFNEIIDEIIAEEQEYDENISYIVYDENGQPRETRLQRLAAGLPNIQILIRAPSPHDRNNDYERVPDSPDILIAPHVNVKRPEEDRREPNFVNRWMKRLSPSKFLKVRQKFLEFIF